MAAQKRWHFAEYFHAVRMAAGQQPIFRASVTARTAKAVNYQHRNGATKIDFRGTDLMAKARGEAYRRPGKMWSFAEGLRLLVETLCSRLTRPPFYGVPVRRVHQD